MPEIFALKSTHKAVRAYYLALAQLANVGAKHESAVRSAFGTLIEAAAAPLNWILVPEYAISRRNAAPLRLDGALLDEYRLVHGCLEAKDDADDLVAEMRAKLKLGYPAKNTLFWQPRRALLVQDGNVVHDYYLEYMDRQLCVILNRFFNYKGLAVTQGECAQSYIFSVYPIRSHQGLRQQITSQVCRRSLTLATSRIASAK